MSETNRLGSLWGRILKETLFLRFSASFWWWLAAPGRAWLADSSFKSLLLVFTWPFPQVSLCLHFLLHKDTSHTRSRAHASPVGPHHDYTWIILFPNKATFWDSRGHNFHLLYHSLGGDTIQPTRISKCWHSPTWNPSKEPMSKSSVTISNTHFYILSVFLFLQFLY